MLQLLFPWASSLATYYSLDLCYTKEESSYVPYGIV